MIAVLKQVSNLSRFIKGGDEVATAIVSLYSVTGTGGVHVNLLMSGLFNNNNNDGAKGSGMTAKFEWNLDNGTSEAVIEDLVIPKVNQV